MIHPILNSYIFNFISLAFIYYSINIIFTSKILIALKFFFTMNYLVNLLIRPKRKTYQVTEEKHPTTFEKGDITIRRWDFTCKNKRN